MARIQKSKPTLLLKDIPRNIQVSVPRKFILNSLDEKEISKKDRRRLMDLAQNFEGKKHQIEHALSVICRAIRKHTEATKLYFY